MHVWSPLWSLQVENASRKIASLAARGTTPPRAGPPQVHLRGGIGAGPRPASYRGSATVRAAGAVVQAARAQRERLRLRARGRRQLRAFGAIELQGGRRPPRLVGHALFDALGGPRASNVRGRGRAGWSAASALTTRSTVRGRAAAGPLAGSASTGVAALVRFGRAAGSAVSTRGTPCFGGVVGVNGGALAWSVMTVATAGAAAASITGACRRATSGRARARSANLEGQSRPRAAARARARLHVAASPSRRPCGGLLSSSSVYSWNQRPGPPMISGKMNASATIVTAAMIQMR
jgi:hypothetical protein